ncbi:MAG: hypothetical protein JJE12_02505 [Anaerolineales bacterium]|nr:hypothetical protein [Anaerolineales bacterium]
MTTHKQPTKRSGYKTVLAWIFAILFVISSIVVIFSFFPVGKILNPQFYQRALEDANIYQRLPQAFANELAVNLTTADGDSNSEIPLVVLSDQEWETILVDLIDPGWIQSQTEQAIDQVFEILLVSPDPMNTPIIFSVSEIKDSFTGAEGVQAINQIIEAQPPCSIDQLVGLVQAGLGMENTVSSILCRPPDFILSEINPFVESFLTTTVGNIPDEIPINIPFSQLEDQLDGYPEVTGRNEIPESLQRLRQVNTLISWSPLLPLFFLLLMTLFAVRSLREFMTWWGSVLFASGSISLLLSVILVPALTWGIETYLPMDLINLVKMPDIFIDIGVSDLFSGLVNQLQLSIIVPAGVMSVLGFALLLGVYLLSRVSPKIQTQHINPPIDYNQG